MKNLVAITNKADIHDYLMSLWKTDIFRDSHRSRSFIYDLVDMFAWLPRFFAETSNDQIERAHFSTWWGVIMLRDDYANPIIHDLYLLHEMYHAAYMPYVPHIGKAAFDDKMQRNELEASVFSEIQVYFEMPGLRALSFDHPIYADRYLNNPKMRALWQGNRKVAIETIRSIRRDVMVSKPEHLMDESEMWIRRFAEQNTAYSLTWTNRYLDIEQRMSDFQSDTVARSRKHAMTVYLGWLRAEAALDSVDGVPFRAEAELFAPFYWANKERYQAAMDEKKKMQRAIG